ncbi:MAG: hypothetical protein P1V51_09945 [Deltaproteobacteria bacterium]|nr:hypothetical protein [Deltaproteobacteria bacterium]
MKLARLFSLALLSGLLLLPACDGGGGGTDGGGGTPDGGDECTAGAETSCTEHFHCKARSVCEEDRGGTICNLADRGGDGMCTFESLAIPGSGDFEVPDVSCYATPATPAGPAMVNFRGCVDVFGLDLDTSGGLVVTVYRMSDGATGTPLGTATSDVDSAFTGLNCSNGGAFDLGAEVVPTNTTLIVKVTDATGEFADTYEYGVVLRADRAAADPAGLQAIEEPATVIAVSTYQVFPQTAGISAGIDGADDLTDGVGRAALAGTISACNRREMANIIVEIDGMDASRIVDSEAGVEGRLAFTDGNENPDVRRSATNIDGVFAAINIKAGTRTLTLKHTLNGTVETLATYTVPVFPDSVTLFSPQGALP